MGYVPCRCQTVTEKEPGVCLSPRLHLVMIAHHLLTHLAVERSGTTSATTGATSATTGEKAVLQGRDALRLPGVERMQSVLRGLIFDDCVSSLTTSKKDKALGRKIKKMIVPAE